MSPDTRTVLTWIVRAFILAVAVSIVILGIRTS